MAYLAGLGGILLAILVLSILILVHELGHFGAARLLGVKVEEFSIFMGPKLWSMTKNGIVYTLRLLPIGGYCRFAGEDEDSDDPNAFFRKPVWVRFVVTLAGAAMNFVLAYVLAVVMCGVIGLATDMPAIRAVEPGAAAQAAGMVPGDRIVSVNGVDVYTRPELDDALKAASGAARIGVNRGGRTVDLDVDASEGLGVSFETPRIGSVEDGFPAKDAGLEAGDRIAAIDGVPVESAEEISERIVAAGEKPLQLTVDRGGRTMQVSMTPIWDEETQKPRIGIRYSADTMTYGWKSFGAGVRLCVNMAKQMVISLGQLFTGGVSVDQMMGPVGIVTEISSQAQQSSMNVLPLALLISLNLGIVNLLPIPALDGSRLVFLVIEGIRRKPFPREKEAMVHFVGLMCLFVFLIFITFNDVKRLF